MLKLPERDPSATAGATHVGAGLGRDLSAQDHWLFVQWGPDRALFEIRCDYQHSLFRLADDDQPPVQVAWTWLGCDV